MTKESKPSRSGKSFEKSSRYSLGSLIERITNSAAQRAELRVVPEDGQHPYSEGFIEAFDQAEELEREINEAKLSSQGDDATPETSPSGNEPSRSSGDDVTPDDLFNWEVSFPVFREALKSTDVGKIEAFFLILYLEHSEFCKEIAFRAQQWMNSKEYPSDDELFRHISKLGEFDWAYLQYISRLTSGASMILFVFLFWGVLFLGALLVIAGFLFLLKTVIVEFLQFFGAFDPRWDRYLTILPGWQFFWLSWLRVTEWWEENFRPGTPSAGRISPITQLALHYKEGHSLIGRVRGPLGIPHYSLIGEKSERHGTMPKSAAVEAHIPPAPEIEERPESEAGINSQIAAVNDQFRRQKDGDTTINGFKFLSPQLMEKGEEVVAEIEELVRAYDDFTPENDPTGTHEHGVVEHKSVGQIIWQIDYYDDDTCEAPAKHPEDGSRSFRALAMFQDGDVPTE